MTEAAFEVEPLSDACGALIRGVDLNALSDAQFGVLRSTLAERGVIFIEDQALDPEQHIAFARRWGDIDINNYFPADARYPEIAEVRKEKEQKTNIGGGWHTDHSYDQIPAMGSILLARETPPTGGDTLFSSMYAAYDGLSEGLKQTLGGLRAVHSADHIYGPDGAYAATDIGATLKGQEIKTGAVHPVVITHPDSGRKALYVNPAFTLRFEGWTREESMTLLGYLYAQAMRPEITCTLKWRPGSIAVWDNRSTWHFAKNDYHGERRLMHRITVAGTALQ
jgi:taurine dioxygenase